MCRKLAEPTSPSPTTQVGYERDKSSVALEAVGLFAGIGALDLGFERAGHRTLLLCELMPEARAVLSAAQSSDWGAFNGADLVEDLTDSGFERRLPEHFDILTAGFPCQDLSQAGSTKGIEGSRSGLITHVLDMIGRRPPARRPRWIILENVPFMRHLERGKAMGVVMSKLSSLGYSWAYREIDTLAFGLPHRRKRLFIVACLNGQGDPRAVLLEGDVNPDPSYRGPGWLEGRACGFYWTEGNRGIGWADDAIPTLKGGSGLGIPSPPAIILPPEGAFILPTIRDAERLQGLPRGWTEAAAAAGPRAGRIRWKLVGNAVSIPAAEWIGTRVRDVTGLGCDRDDDVLPPDSKWPSAAWQMDPDGHRFVAKVGPWPCRQTRIPLFDLIREEEDDRRQLSVKATSGFLARFSASTLLARDPRHRSALIGALQRHLDVLAVG